MAMTASEIESLIKAAFPDAEVQVEGRNIFSPHEAEVRSLRA